ncbi:CocE/NonD family hydrolase [Chloroflexota bacterium]
MTQISTVRGPLVPEVKLEEDVYVTMRDGVKLAVDVYRPKTEGRYPVLLSMSPYIKECQLLPPALSHSIEAGNTNFFVPKGYVHVIVQIRGTVLSQGQYNFFDIKEQQDGYDLVEWCAQQPWCDGNVGMIGDSYFAMIQYLVAAQQPPHLKCIAPFDGATDIYRDFCYQGGIFFAWFIGTWGVGVLTTCAYPGPVEGKLPPANFIADIGANIEDGPYYWERSPITKIDKINVPILNMVAHRGFLHSRGQLDGHAKIKTPKKLMVMAPSGLHQHELFITSPPLNEYMLKWYDYWLKGIDTGIMNEPPVIIYDSANGEWNYENEYPLARTEWTKFYLRANPAGPATQPPYGLLSTEPAESEEPDVICIEQAVGLVAEGKPVLAYSTPPLEKDIRVWGPFSANLYASTTTLDAYWFVKMTDIGPDGNATPVSLGHLKASFREVDESKSGPGQPYHPFRNPVRPEPNKVYEYQIEMLPMFHTFKEGHRISMQIASDDLWYQGQGRSIIAISEMLPAPSKQTIYHDSVNPSHLLLPVIPDTPVTKPVEPPVSQIKWPV